MNTFNQKPPDIPERVGHHLRALRLEYNINLDTLSKRTRISKKYLEALEQCRFDDIPFAPIYQKNFVKLYAEAIGENPDPFVTQFSHQEMNSVIDHASKTDYSQPLKRNHLHNLPNILRYAAILTIALLFLAYIGVQVHNILTPPQLTLLSPQDGMITTDNTIIVQGETENETEVFINGTPIKHGENGAFHEEIDLIPGVNTILITAKNKHGKTTNEERHIILKNDQFFSYRLK